MRDGRTSPLLGICAPLLFFFQAPLLENFDEAYALRFRNRPESLEVFALREGRFARAHRASAEWSPALCAQFDASGQQALLVTGGRALMFDGEGHPLGETKLPFEPSISDRCAVSTSAGQFTLAYRKPKLESSHQSELVVVNQGDLVAGKWSPRLLRFPGGPANGIAYDHRFAPSSVEEWVLGWTEAQARISRGSLGINYALPEQINLPEKSGSTALLDLARLPSGGVAALWAQRPSPRKRQTEWLRAGIWENKKWRPLGKHINAVPGITYSETRDVSLLANGDEILLAFPEPEKGTKTSNRIRLRRWSFSSSAWLPLEAGLSELGTQQASAWQEHPRLWREGTGVYLTWLETIAARGYSPTELGFLAAHGAPTQEIRRHLSSSMNIFAAKLENGRWKPVPGPASGGALMEGAPEILKYVVAPCPAPYSRPPGK